MTKEDLVEKLGNHLARRFIPDSVPEKPGMYPLLHANDAHELAFIAIDWLKERGQLPQLGR